LPSLTADELGKLDAGSWKDKKYAGEPVPRLTQIADVCRGKSIMMLDLKAEGQGKAIAAWLDAGGHCARPRSSSRPVDRCRRRGAFASTSKTSE
jgi:hypothetical protein